MKGYIIVRELEGYVYAELRSWNYLGRLIAQSSLHTSWIRAVIEMRRYAEHQAITIKFTSTILVEESAYDDRIPTAL